MICVQAARSPHGRDASGSGCPVCNAFIAGCNHSMKANTSLNLKSAVTAVELDALLALPLETSEGRGEVGFTFLERG